MKLEIYSIRDIKVAYRSPIYFHNVEEAKRACSFTVNSNSDNELVLAPQDFELWYLGSIDDTTGIIEPAHEFITNLADFKRREVIANETV